MSTAVLENIKIPKILSLTQQTANGVKWAVGASFFQKSLSFGTMIILARILNPSIFGLFALAFVAIDGLGLFKSMGFDSALIQRKDNIEKAANTAFFIIPALGILLFIILAVSAPYIGNFLNSQEAIPVMRALGLIFVFSCFSMVPKALLQKEMRFAKLALFETISAVIYSLVSISLALSGFGVWSLVIGYLAKTMMVMVLVWYFSKWKPRWQFDKKIAKQMFHFGRFVFLSSLVYFLRMNLDNVLVGKFLGVAMLGVYALSFSISNMLIDHISGKMERVIYPAYSKKQNDTIDLKNAFLEVLKVVSFIALPFTFFLYLLRTELIYTIYGSKWLEVIPIIQILIWSGLFRMLATSAGALFMAKGKPQYGFWLMSLQVLIFLIFIVPFSRLFGVKGVSIVVTSGVLLNTYLIFILLKKLLKLGFIEVCSKIKLPLIATLLMSIGILITKWFMVNVFFINNHGAILAVSLFVALGGYVFFITKIDRQFIARSKVLILGR